VLQAISFARKKGCESGSSDTGWLEVAGVCGWSETQPNSDYIADDIGPMSGDVQVSDSRSPSNAFEWGESAEVRPYQALELVLL